MTMTILLIALCKVYVVAFILLCVVYLCSESFEHDSTIDRADVIIHFIVWPVTLVRAIVGAVTDRF